MSVDATTQIKEGVEVRIKVVGVRADTQGMVSIERDEAICRRAKKGLCMPCTMGFGLLGYVVVREPARKTLPIFAVPLCLGLRVHCYGDHTVHIRYTNG